jgi:hypothetical protein
MVDKVEPNPLDAMRESHHHQRYFKLTRKGRVPKVTREWPAEEKPWYIRYAYDWMLLLITILLLVTRAVIVTNEWIAFSLDVLMMCIFFMWLTTLTPEQAEKKPRKW